MLYVLLLDYNFYQMNASNKKQPTADYIAKTILVGDTGVGKTNILCRFCNNQYKPNLLSTVGIDFKNKTIDVQDSKVKLQIWDTAGQQRFKNINQTYFKGALSVILVYSINNEQSFKSITSWINQIKQNSDVEISKFLVAAKCDLVNERIIATKQGMKIASSNNIAKDSTNIEALFNKVGEKVLKVLKTRKKGKNDANNNNDHDKRISLDKKDDQSKKQKCKC